MTENSTQPTDRKYDDLFKVKKKLYFVHENVNLSLCSIYIGTVSQLSSIWLLKLHPAKHEIIPTISCSVNFKLNATVYYMWDIRLPKAYLCNMSAVFKKMFGAYIFFVSSLENGKGKFMFFQRNNFSAQQPIK